MAKNSFPPALKDVLVHEGDYTADPRDPGNWTGGKRGVGVLKGTKKGISAASFPHLDIKNLNDNQISDIYYKKYWVPIKGDLLPSGPDLSIFDYGVNSGTSRSVKDAQRVVGAKVDGVLGVTETLPKIQKYPPRDFIKAHCGRRMSFLRSLAIWNTFGKGWSRRVASVEAKGLSWVSSKAQLEADAKAARDKAIAQGGGAVVTPGAGVGVDQAPDISGFPVWAIVLIVVAIAAPLVIRAIVNGQRASALNDVAKEA